ncbi:dsDNA-specific endonuclease/ATPase MutS2 [Bradyrhizobium sp. USDA 3397]
MDWKAFIASTTGALAWPVTVVFIVALFSKEIRALFRRFKRLGAAGVQLELADEVDKARSEAEIVQSEQNAPATTAAKLDSATIELARSSPAVAVLQSFKEVEELLLAIRTQLPDNKPHRNLNEVLGYLKGRGLISESVISLFQRLRKTTKAVSHATEDSLTPGETFELIGQSRLLLEVLKAAQRRLVVQPA